MNMKVRNRRRFRSLVSCGLILGAWAAAGSPALGFDNPQNYPIQPKPKPKGIKGLLSHRETTYGSLGYGPPGPQPGYQGFGLKYGLNYGFGGGNALGVGADGGYPLYGGPGYVHPGPQLRRAPGITAFPYYGGPGNPTPTCPQFYGEAGPLSLDPPVVRYEDDPDGTAGANDFGRFTGMLPYPERTFAPFSTDAANALDRAVEDSIVDPQAPPPPPPPPAPGGPGLAPFVTGPVNPIGIDTEPVLDGGSARGLKITKVHPGTAAARSGLATGDVIRSANGYVTEQARNLDWIAANAAPDKTLTLSVRTARDGEVRLVSARIR